MEEEKAETLREGIDIWPVRHCIKCHHLLESVGLMITNDVAFWYCPACKQVRDPDALVLWFHPIDLL